MEEIQRRQIRELIQREVVVATGCTEPGAVLSPRLVKYWAQCQILPKCFSAKTYSKTLWALVFLAQEW